MKDRIFNGLKQIGHRFIVVHKCKQVAEFFNREKAIEYYDWIEKRCLWRGLLKQEYAWFFKEN